MQLLVKPISAGLATTASIYVSLLFSLAVLQLPFELGYLVLHLAGRMVTRDREFEWRVAEFREGRCRHRCGLPATMCGLNRAPLGQAQIIAHAGTRRSPRQLKL